MFEYKRLVSTIFNYRIDALDYLMQEIRELRQHAEDLRNEHYLLMHDNRLIRESKNVCKIILTRDYFEVEQQVIGGEATTGFQN